MPFPAGRRQAPTDHANLVAKWRRPAFSLCTGYGLVRRDSIFSRRELDAFYARAWDAPLDNPAETGGTDDSRSREYVRELIRTRKLSPGARVLDYGVGRGAVLHRVCGRPDLTPSASSLTGLSLLLADLLGWLKPGGCIVISTPNPNGLRARLQGGKWREAANPGHLCFLTPDLLARLLREAGFLRPRPLFWDVRYAKNPLRQSAHLALSRLGALPEMIGHPFGLLP